MPDYKIWIFFSDTGGGHRSAAEAIEATLEEVVAKDHPGCKLDLVMDTPAERSHPVNRVFVDLYNRLLRHHQAWMKYYYWFLHAVRPDDSLIGYLLIKPFLRKLFGGDVPAVLVSVHPMINHVLVRVRREMRLPFKLIVVVTDPNRDLWRGWGVEEADLTIVPNDLAADRLTSWGVPPERIRVLGMPVHPDFLRPPRIGRVEFLGSLGLDPRRLTVCLNAGWAGGGNMMQVFEKLSLVKRPIQALFLCGHNSELFEQARAYAARLSVKTAVLPFHDSMADVMSACDLMVTKAGGLTTFEAIARRLPIAFDLITPPMPQEAGNVRIVVEQGLAQEVIKAHDIVDIVENFEIGAERKLPAAYQLDRTDAVYD